MNCAAVFVAASLNCGAAVLVDASTNQPGGWPGGGGGRSPELAEAVRQLPELSELEARPAAGAFCFGNGDAFHFGNGVGGGVNVGGGGYDGGGGIDAPKEVALMFQLKVGACVFVGGGAFVFICG